MLILRARKILRDPLIPEHAAWLSEIIRSYVPFKRGNVVFDGGPGCSSGGCPAASARVEMSFICRFAFVAVPKGLKSMASRPPTSPRRSPCLGHNPALCGAAEGPGLPPGNRRKRRAFGLARLRARPKPGGRGATFPSLFQNSLKYQPECNFVIEALRRRDGEIVVRGEGPVRGRTERPDSFMAWSFFLILWHFISCPLRQHMWPT